MFGNNTKKSIAVVSHERSGTHFLINSIADNFGLPCAPVNIGGATGEATPEEVKHQLCSRRAARPAGGESSRRIFKSHHDVSFFEHGKEDIAKNCHVFYIHRNCKDVLTSMYHYFYIHKEQFPWSQDVSTFCFDLKLNNDIYASKEYDNFVERWKNHVEGWLSSDIGHKLSYEELHSNFDETVLKIGRIMGELPKNNRIVRPGLDEGNSVCPRKGIIGDWRNLMNNELSLKIDAVL